MRVRNKPTALVLAYATGGREVGLQKSSDKLRELLASWVADNPCEYMQTGGKLY